MKRLVYGVVGAAMAVIVAGVAFAQPTNLRNHPEVGKQLWKFNVISLPENIGRACR